MNGGGLVALRNSNGVGWIWTCTALLVLITLFAFVISIAIRISSFAGQVVVVNHGMKTVSEIPKIHSKGKRNDSLRDGISDQCYMFVDGMYVAAKLKVVGNLLHFRREPAS